MKNVALWRVFDDTSEVAYFFGPPCICVCIFFYSFFQFVPVALCVVQNCVRFSMV